MADLAHNEAVHRLQEQGKFSEMSDRDKEIQASIWAMLFMLSEVSLALRVIRDTLTQRGALLPEDEGTINATSSNLDKLELAYNHIEKGFREKFARIRYSMENPQEVEAAVERGDFSMPAEKRDLATVSG